MNTSFCISTRDVRLLSRYRVALLLAIIGLIIAGAIHRSHSVPPEDDSGGDGDGPFAVTSADAADGGFAMRYDADASCYYVIEASSSLAEQDWTAVHLLVGEPSELIWAAPSGFDSSRSFRIRELPCAAPRDHDQDGLDDVAELTLGTDPLNPDTDGDGLLDSWEVLHHLDPLDDGSNDPSQGPDGDPDADGLVNALEALLGLSPHEWNSVLNAPAALQTKSYSVLRHKFLEMPAYKDPDVPVITPPVYYLRATVDATMRDANNLHIPGFEQFRVWRRAGSITVDPQTMKPTGTYTSSLDLDKYDPDPLFASDATYTFTYTWNDGVPNLTINVEGHVGGEPTPMPDGEARCTPWVGDARLHRDIGIADAFARKYIGDGAVSQDRIEYAYDEAHPDGEWTIKVDGSATLSQEFTTDLLNALTEQALDEMPSLRYHWPGLSWDSHYIRKWPWAFCGEIVDSDAVGGNGLRQLRHPEENSLELRRAKFRFRVDDTEPGQVYVLQWEERFHPLPPNDSAEETAEIRAVFFLGVGGPMVVGAPSDNQQGGTYAALLGTAAFDDFTLDPPPRERGNGSVTVNILPCEIPRRVIVDLDLDANYDGVITEEDDPLEMNPGGIAGVNDTALSAMDRNLIPIRMRIEHEEDLDGTVELRVEAPPHRVALWMSPNMETPATQLSWNLGEGDTMPEILYVEGLTVSTYPGDVLLRLIYSPPGGRLPIEDWATLSIVRCDLGFDINLDGLIDANDDVLESTQHGKLLRVGTGTPDDRDTLHLGLLPKSRRATGTLQLKIDDPSILRLYDDTGTQILGPETTDTWALDREAIESPAWPTVLSAEGAAPGQTTLTLTYIAESGQAICQDSAQVTVVSFDLVPDWNRDLKIDDADRGQVTAENPFRFWINDDQDSKGEDAGNDYDAPGSSKPDASDLAVNTLRDLADFYPVFLDLQQPLAQLGRDDFQYFVSHYDTASQSKHHFMYTDLSPSASGSYLTHIPTAKAVADKNLISFCAYNQYVHPHGMGIPNSFLDAVAAGNGILLLEHAEPTTEPLVARIVDRHGNLRLETTLPLSISSVEDMFAQKDLRGIVAKDLYTVANDWSGTPQDRFITTEPANYPDSLTNDKAFIFTHGYNNNLQIARGGHAEMFKRLFWSGSKAKYYGVSWYGYQDQMHMNWLFGQAWVCPNYQGNVINAFKTAPAYAEFVSSIQKPTKIVAAHSLGNIMLSSAIQDHALQVDQYYMINAAVSAEAYSAIEEPVDIDMVHVDWGALLVPAGGTNDCSKLFCYNWYKLFDGSDSRSALTWNGRFTGVASVAYNFWSEGDQTFFVHPHNETPGAWPGWDTVLNATHAWCIQEKRKGRAGLLAAGGSYIGGWGFNEYHSGTVNPELIPDSVLRTEPFFKKGDADTIENFQDLFDPAKPTAANESLTHAALLATFVPAKRPGLGATSNVLGVAPNRQFEMQYNFNNGGWHDSLKYDQGIYWDHGEFKVAAMAYVYELYEKFVEIGDLNEE